MAMTKLTCMRGFSGSGKSTKAAEIAKETGAVIVNRDYLRKMLLGEWWTGNVKDEEAVTVAEDNLVGDFLTVGQDVIVDATHLNARYLRKWAKLATKLGAEFEVVDVDTPLDLCLNRNLARALDGERAVEQSVIQSQAKRFPMENWPTVTAEPPFVVEPAIWRPGLPEAIIVDIDGTVAHMAGRSPYDYSQVHTDTVDEQITWLVRIIRTYYCEGDHVKVLFVSGRDHTCREATEKWLAYNGIVYDELYMRPADAKDARGNKLPDYQVKYDLFNKHIRDKYNVHIVLDDRDQVVTRCWRAMGLKCLQVAPGDF